MHAATVAFTLFAASQVIGAPTAFNDARSIDAISNAIGNFAEDVLGPTTAKRDADARSLSAIENFFSNLKRDEDVDARSLSAIKGVVDDIFGKRSLSAIENFFSNLKRDEQLDARSLSAIENFFSNLKRGEGVDARSLSAIESVVDDIFGKRSLSAIENFFSNLKRGEDVDARSISAIEGVVHDIFDKRSLKAVGAAVAGGVASGVAGAVGNAVLNNKRSGPSGLMIDAETGTLYMDVPDANEGRSLKAVGAAVAGGVASGVAGAVGNAVLNNRRSSSGVMIDTDTGVLYMDVADVNDSRSLKAVGAAVAGGVASGVAGAVGNAVLNNKRADSGLMVDTDSGLIYMDVPDSNGARSLKAVGTAVAGGIASGVAGAVGNAVLNNKRSDSGIMIDTDTGVIDTDILDATEGRSLKAVGTAIAGGVASLATGAAANDVLGNNRRSLSAIEGVIDDIFNKRSLSAIENFFSNLKRDEHDARSLSAIENFFSNLKRSELEESMAKRSIDDLE
ncbi:unnamed protein product [Peniophora sp. CBMAI 1063]|nr:unnamed protein product [Peniophora sp. CBMAI 1063]